MLKVLLVCSLFFSFNAFSQIENKPDPDSQVNAQEQANGLPGGSEAAAYSVRTKKRMMKMPAVTPLLKIFHRQLC